MFLEWKFIVKNNQQVCDQTRHQRSIYFIPVILFFEIEIKWETGFETKN
jgi:hypothetical protein